MPKSIAVKTGSGSTSTLIPEAFMAAVDWLPAGTTLKYNWSGGGFTGSIPSNFCGVNLDELGFPGWWLAHSGSGNPNVVIGFDSNIYVTASSVGAWKVFCGESATTLMAVKCTILYDTDGNSISISFVGGSKNDADFAGSDACEENSLLTCFLAKDVKGNIFGGVGTPGQSLLIGESGVCKYNNTDLLASASNANQLEIAYLTNMVNLTDDDAPLAKSMMMAVTLPEIEANDKKFGTYYSIGGNRYGNLSVHNLNKRSSLADPWCPY